MGKSALLSRWLDLQEQRGREVPHHFLRRDVMDWDRPETVVLSLAAQIEELYPAQRDPQARPCGRWPSGRVRPMANPSQPGTADGIIIPPYPGRTRELVTSLLAELRSLRAAAPSDPDLEAAERAAAECAARLDAVAARQTDQGIAADGIIIPPYPGAAPPADE